MTTILKPTPTDEGTAEMTQAELIDKLFIRQDLILEEVQKMNLRLTSMEQREADRHTPDNCRMNNAIKMIVGFGSIILTIAMAVCTFFAAQINEVRQFIISHIAAGLKP